jgi:hypothetical protein
MPYKKASVIAALTAIVIATATTTASKAGSGKQEANEAGRKSKRRLFVE